MIHRRRAGQRILNCIPSQKIEKDWRFEHAIAGGILQAKGSIPASRDLRESWWQVGDQKGTGSCVGWAVSDGLLRWHFVKEGRISKEQRLSVRYIWMAAKETDEFTSYPTTFIETKGTSLKAALDIARKFGIVDEDVLDFSTGDLYPGDTEAFYAMAARLKIASYINLGSDLKKWRTWLATKGPIAVRLEVDDTWYHALKTRGEMDRYLPKTSVSGHAACLVGYTPDYFIVRNSWGTKAWGDKGFGYASNKYAKAAFIEAYGISL